MQPALFARKIQQFVDGNGGKRVGKQVNQIAVDDFAVERIDVFEK